MEVRLVRRVERASFGFAVLAMFGQPAIGRQVRGRFLETTMQDNKMLISFARYSNIRHGGERLVREFR